MPASDSRRARWSSWSGLGVWLVAAGCAAQADAPPAAAPAVEVRAEPAPTAEVDVPIERAGSGHLVVRARIGEGAPMAFVLDSGASVSVITPATRRAVGLAADAGRPVAAHGAGGAMSDVRLVTLPPLHVGESVVREHQAAVMPLSHLEAKLGTAIAGILGRNFLDGRVVQLDLADRRLRLYAPGAAPPLPPGAFPFERIEPVGLIRIMGSVFPGDAAVATVFDLGAGRSVMSWSAARAAGFTPKDPRVRPVADDLLGADATAVEAVEVPLAGLVVGSVRFDHPAVLVADLPVFGALGLGDEPAMVLGLDLLEGRRITVDYPAAKMAISPPASTAARAAPSSQSTKGSTALRSGG